jgi:hypothetical protein
MSKISLEVGLLLRGQVRRLLENAVFYNQLESYKEVRGFLSSDFLLTNPTPDLVEWLESRMKDKTDEV